MAKSDKITVAKRVQDVSKLILMGAAHSDIEAFGTERGWNVSRRQLQRYVKIAHEQMAKASLQNRQQLIGRHVLQRRALFARALKAGDLRTALQAVKDEAQLQGVYPGKGSAASADSERQSRDLSDSPL